MSNEPAVWSDEEGWTGLPAALLFFLAARVPQSGEELESAHDIPCDQVERSGDSSDGEVSPPMTSFSED